MTMQPNSSTRPITLDGASDRAVVSFFNTVYAWMAVGLGLTALVGWGVSQSPAMVRLLYSGPGAMVAIALGAFALSWYVQRNILNLSVGVATALYLAYCVVIGCAISYVFIVYSIPTLAGSFIITAGTFAAMSLYGFVTKRDLSAIGSVLAMAVMGLFLASIVNLFWANDALSWIITYAVLAVFIGLTAAQTQRLRQMAEQYRGQPQIAAKFAIVGSLVLYIAFINMFLSILRIMGNRR